MYLSDLKIGESGIVEGINLSAHEIIRINGMGVVGGVKVTVIRFAPLGDPIEIKVRDVYLGIRKSQASKISVRRIKAGKDE